MIKIILVRHGYSEANKANRFCGQHDAPLDERGRIQANEVSEYIKSTYNNISAIYSSDLSRAYDTLLPLSEKIGVPITKDKNLREIDVGDWYGLSASEAAERFPDSYRAYKENPWKMRFDGGEGYADAQARAVHSIIRIKENHDNETVAVATHGGIIRAIVAEFSGISPENANEIPLISNASVTVLCLDGEKTEFSVIGYCDYLSNKTEDSWVK